ncbi:MAG TPA: hypothetical protein DCE55_15860 [Planctomycetaceae bacterium]|nr:hypothetical protein [Planctomycetaceae bacterium]|tara:strand:+ start:30789 stop:32384 length:1596 start_codon:yes stop_codon:yes gene_type:complete
MDTPASRQQRKHTRSWRYGRRLHFWRDIEPLKVANWLLVAALVFPLAHVPSQVPAQPPATSSSEASILPLLGKARSPRAQLAQAGIDDSHWHQFVDGSALSEADEETLLKILFRLPRLFSSYDLERMAHQKIPVDITEEPDPHRGKVLVLQGNAVAVEKVNLVPRLAQLFEFNHFFRVRIQHEKPPHEIVLCSRTIPLGWQRQPISNEPVQVRGLFLKLGETVAGQPQLVCAASRLAWLPSRANPATGIRKELVLLAQHGMDAGLFDALQKTNRRRIQSADRECFYQLLATSTLIPEKQLAPFAGPLNLETILTRPETQHGTVHQIRAQARRITRVVVTDKDIVERYGIEYYYQIDGALPLGLTTVTTGKKQQAKRLKYTNTYPATFCVRELPTRLAAIDRRLSSGQSTTENLNETIILNGWFFKLWSYRSRFTEAYSENMPQVSPMFLAARPRLPRPKSGSTIPGLVGGSLFVVAIGIVWFLLWRSSRRESRQSQRAASTHRPAHPTDLNQLLEDVSAQPDFSNLAEEAE